MQIKYPAEDQSEDQVCPWTGEISGPWVGELGLQSSLQHGAIKEDPVVSRANPLF